MTEKSWYYRRGEEEVGPFGLEELAKKLDEGEIDAETYVKSTTQPEWVHIKEVKELNIEFLDPHPPVTKPEIANRDYPEEERSKRWTRPWIRFWARMLDYSLISYFLFFLSGITQIPFALVAPMYIPFVGTLLWVFIEALFLSTWGRTPGKWLFRICIHMEGGGKPSYRQALARSFGVWWMGLGAALPIISIITMIVANVKLSNLGETSWDRLYNFEVEHKKIGFFRTFIAILYFVFLFSYSMQVMVALAS
ncbi:MAG: RDD family protein [Candidatus Algichlamydia australiensis]|nr:RDD family protein [Chlamydiales bacterium]